MTLFESAQPEDPRPRQAIEHARAWVSRRGHDVPGSLPGGLRPHSTAAAGDGVICQHPFAAGEAAAVAHVAAHQLGAAAYAIKGRTRCRADEARASAPGDRIIIGSATSSIRACPPDLVGTTEDG